MGQKGIRVGWKIALAAVVFAGLAASRADAQGAAGNPFAPAPSGALDTLSGIQAPTAAGNIGLQRARAIQQQQNANPLLQSMNFGGFDTPFGNQTPAAPAIPGDLGAVGESIQEALAPKVKVISGTRVFDAVTGELLDDARIKWVSESEKDLYYDDATHGDEVEGDGVYTKVDSTHEFISQSNQRLKERLIQALVVSDELNPLDFYGYSLMTTERNSHPPRNRRWRIVRDPEGIGFKLEDVPAEKPLKVPKLQEEQRRKDEKIAGEDGWAKLFLEEYRISKGNMDSQFYPVHVPQPPDMPRLAPPPGELWTPFPNPEGLGDTVTVRANNANSANGPASISFGSGFGG